MGFPDNILTKDEKVVRSLHPHWLTVFAPTLIGLLIVAGAVVIVLLTPVTRTWDIVDWVVIGLGILLMIVFVVVPYLRWRTTHYVITNKRVAVRRGILSKSGQDMALSKITDVSFHQSLLDRIIRSGSLHIETAGDSLDEDIANIPRSNDVQQLINRLIEEDAAYRGGYGDAARRGYQQMAGRHAQYHPPSEPPVEQSDPGTAPVPPRPDPRSGRDRPAPGPPPDPRGGARDTWETPPAP